MRPKSITPRRIILLLLGVALFAGMVIWLKGGAKLPFVEHIPSTAGKLIFVTAQDGNSDIYLSDGADASKNVDLTNDNKGADDEPAWSPKGDTIALTSDRSGTTRQLYVMNALPGATVAVRTNSSSTKQAPQFGATGEVIYFLDGGRIAKLNPDTGDIDLVFPTTDQTRGQQESASGPTRHLISDLFASGGVTRFAVTPDGNLVLAAVKQEQGEALLLYQTGSHEVDCLGLAERIFVQASSDNSFTVLLNKGSVLSHPIHLLSPADANSSTTPIEEVPPYTPADTGMLIRLNSSLGVVARADVAIDGRGLAVAADGSQAIVTDNTSKQAGVYLALLNGPSDLTLVTNLPASEPAISPDGKKVAVTSKDDIYIVPIDTNAPPVNLTNGKGKSHGATWSPATPAK